LTPDLSARFSLLDAQVVDADDLPIGRVDDVELAVPPDGGPPRVEALLTGAEALGPRVGGTLGRLMTAVAARLRLREEPDGPTKIDPSLVSEVEPLVKLAIPLSDLPDVAGLERWLARHFVARLPGAGDAPR
jgi:hypothetical protein